MKNHKNDIFIGIAIGVVLGAAFSLTGSKNEAKKE